MAMDGHTLYSGYRERNVSVKLNEAEYQQMLAIREEMRRTSRASNSDAIRYALRAIYETEAEPAARMRENWQAARREKRARPLNEKANAEEKRTWAALMSARTSLWHLERIAEKKTPGA